MRTQLGFPPYHSLDERGATSNALFGDIFFNHMIKILGTFTFTSLLASLLVTSAQLTSEYFYSFFYDI